MTSSLSKKMLGEQPGMTQQRASQIATWEKTKPWTRTDTCRFLNERSAPLLALLRRIAPERAPSHSGQIGYWLKENATAAFNRAHERLTTAGDDSTRDKLLPSELL